MQQSPAARVRIRTFGGFRLDLAGRDGRAQPVPLPRKPLRLLQFLIATNGDGTSTRTIADALWPDADADAAHHAFEVTLHRLRGLLGVPEALLLRTGTLRLNRAMCRLDLWVVDDLIREVDGGPPRGRIAGLARELLTEYRGEFLAGVEAVWVGPARWRITSRFGRAVEQLGDRLVADGHVDDAIHLYRRALEVEPLSDALYHRCLAVLERGDRPGEASTLRRAYALHAGRAAGSPGRPKLP